MPSFIEDRILPVLPTECVYSSVILKAWSTDHWVILRPFSEHPWGQKDFIMILRGYSFSHYVDIHTLYKSNDGYNCW